MTPREGEREQHLRHEVAIAGRVEGVGRQGPEPERLLHEDPVHGEARPRERARAERQLGGATAGVREPLAIAHQRPRVREQHVGPPHRLRALPVRVTRQQIVHPVARARDQRAAELGEIDVQLVDCAQRPQSQVGRDLIVARATGVQLPRRRADLFVQQPLDQRVDVFVRGAHGGAVGEPLGDAVEPLEQRGLLGGGEHAHAAQRVDPRLARRDVLGPQPVVHGQAAVQRLQRLARAEGEAPTPHLVLRRLDPVLGRHQSAAAPSSALRAASSPAPIRIARPYSRMKPAASRWSYTLSFPNVA